MSPAELPKGSVPGAFFRKVGKPEFAKATPAARYLSWLLLGVGDTSEQALAACGPRFGARDPCAGRSPPGARAIRARAAHRRGRAQSVRGLLTAGRFACPAGYSGLSGAIAPGADKPRLRPSARLTRGGSSDPSPYVIPTSAWRDRIGRTPVRLERDCLTEPAPLFAAQPAKVFCQAFFQKSGKAVHRRALGRPVRARCAPAQR